MHIRPATENDVMALALLHLLMWHELADYVPPGFGDDFRLSDPNEDIQRFVAAHGAGVEDDDTVLLVAIENDIILGYVSAYIEDAPDPLLPGGFMTIEYLFVTADQRSNGVARKLVREAERIAKSRGITYVDILVWATNESMLGLGQSAGYQVIEQRLARRLS